MVLVPWCAAVAALDDSHRKMKKNGTHRGSAYRGVPQILSAINHLQQLKEGRGGVSI